MPSRHSHSHYHYPQHSPHPQASRMPSPRLPPLDPRRSRRELTWHSNSYYESHAPSVNTSIYQHPYPPMLPNPHQPSLTPGNLPSRIAALNRRAAIVSSSLAHLTTVVRPLETVSVQDLTQTQLHDMHQERVGLVQAIKAFEDQADEALGILARVLNRRRMGPTRDWDEESVDEWEIEGWGRGRGQRSI